VERKISLGKLFADRCLIPGRFEVRLDFADTSSPVFQLGIEYTAASVPLLLEIALDETSGTWSRRQARALLRELPEPPALEPSPATGDDLAASAADYLRAFPELARTPAFAAFFERIRLPR
jgi:hypothetical protein